MIDRHELTTQLQALSIPELRDIFREVYASKQVVVEDWETPGPGAGRDEYAAWLARVHLSADPALNEVVYLPKGAPADEVRLLEVNVSLPTPEAEAIEAFAFTPGPPGGGFRVAVADVTPEQWAYLLEDPSPLPAGWSLGGRVAWDRT